MNQPLPPGRNTDFAPLWAALDPLLQSGTRRIYLWDGNHFSREPREIAGDGVLFDLANRYGRPFYVVEGLSADNIVQRYVEGTPAQKEAIIERLMDGASNYAQSQYDQAAYILPMVRILEWARLQRADVLGPDPRLAQPMPNLTPGEANIRDRMMRFMREHGGPDALTPELLRPFIASLSQQEQRDLESFGRKFQAHAAPGAAPERLDTAVTDRQITQRVAAFRAQHGIGEDRVQIMLYGVGHFMRPNDLDDANPGVSILIMDRPGALQNFSSVIRMEDRPDYVWYEGENRLVKLDNPQAIQEMLGMNQPLPLGERTLPPGQMRQVIEAVRQ